MIFIFDPKTKRELSDSETVELVEAIEDSIEMFDGNDIDLSTLDLNLGE